MFGGVVSGELAQELDDWFSTPPEKIMKTTTSQHGNWNL